MSNRPNYLLVGDGRLASHLGHYLSLLQISFDTWSRRANTQQDLQQKIQKANRVLLLISDHAIEPFAKL